MESSTLAPVFTGLRLGLHVLLAGLAGFAVARAIAGPPPAAAWAAAVGLAFIVVYLGGAWAARTGRAERPSRKLLWVMVLTLLWAVLTWLSPEGAFIVFPLFFLYLRVLPGAGGVTAVVVATGFAICALGLHHGFSVGGVLGPLVGAGVALLIGLACSALTREAQERERLLAELVRTREQLAETERTQGALAERARLAREIHDTVAQGLTSIQMLLRAAAPHTDEPGAGYLELARQTAGDSLSDTRQIIRELTPARLGEGLPAALRRLGEEEARRADTPVVVSAPDLALPMGVQTALLRIAQGALANAVRHSHATRIAVELTGDAETVSLSVRDDGGGFDVSTANSDPSETDSFGLQAMRERAQQLDGTLEVVSAPTQGTVVTVRLPRAMEPGRRP